MKTEEGYALDVSGGTIAAAEVRHLLTRTWLGVDVRACTYDELINDNNVDTVYIPLPTTTHKEWVIKTARAKKHILDRIGPPEFCLCRILDRA